MIKELLPNLYQIQIPLPESPLKYVNSYVIRAPDRNLVIDTGLNRKECLRAMQTGLGKLEVDLRKTNFYITHLHADHFGLLSKLVANNSKVYVNGPDKEFLEVWDGWEPIISYARKNGFPEDELQAALHNHPGFKYRWESIPELSILNDGDTVKIGDYLFKGIQTPGHSRGHTCLYEPSKKILVSGDHILKDITPNIQCWREQENPLKNYLASLDKIYGLEVDLVLPGHRRLFKDHRERIEELKEHHRKRSDEILSILAEGPKNAFQVASKMTWDIDYESWDLFPVVQKWFATGEAIAHLRYLEENAMVFRKTEAQIITFFK